jgi:hypothetical protein
MAEAPSMEVTTPPVTEPVENLPPTSKESTKTSLTHSLTIKLDERNFLL